MVEGNLRGFEKMKARHWLAGASAVLLAVHPALALDPIPAEARLLPDLKIQAGTLANGLRYAIVPSGSPAGAISIRLMVAAGSYDEEESELGYAHFVEHMAFRSTRSAPGGVMDNRLASLGVAFGRDQNAATSHVATVYRVDLPKKDMKGVAEILAWMRDAADGIRFDAAAVEAERGVILAEMRTHSGPEREVQRQIAEFQGPEMRSTKRDIIGTHETLTAARGVTLQAFHSRWYRPDNAMVVIAGDIDPAEAKRLMEESFSSWKAQGEKPKRVPAPTSLPARGTDALVISSETLPNALTACRVAPLDVAREPSLERLRREQLSDLWLRILNARLMQRAGTAGAGYLGAGGVVSRDMPDARGTCLIAVPAGGKWQEALAAVQGELRRLAAEGPTKKEVAQAIEQMGIQTTVSEIGATSRPTPALADEIVDAAVYGRIIESPEERQRSLRLVVGSATPADVKEALAHDWSGSGPFLALIAPKAADKAQLLDAWAANDKAAPLAAYADADAVEWPYAQFGKKGKIVRREKTAVAGVQRYHFKNGLVFSFKPTTVDEKVEIRVVFGHGERALRPEDRARAALAGGLLAAGGLGKIDFEGVRQAFGHDSWVPTLNALPDAWAMSASTYGYLLEGQLQLLAAYVTDPAFGPLLDEKIPTALDIGYRSAAADPFAAAIDAVDEKLFPDRKTMPRRESLDNLRAVDLAALLAPLLKQAPLELTIVGNVSEKAVKNAVARTFGALPPRAPLPAATGAGPFKLYPETLPGRLTATHQGAPDKAAATLTWPLFVAEPSRRAEEYAIDIMSSVFQMRVLQRLRGQMGKVYSPMVANTMPDHGDQGVLTAAIEGAPGEVDALVAATRAVAGELAAGQISQEEVDGAREPLLAARRQVMDTNTIWANMMAIGYRHPSAFDEVLLYEKQMKAVALDHVRAAAARWLKGEPLVAVALPAPPAGSAPSRAGPAAAPAR
jgi:zinc protease